MSSLSRGVSAPAAVYGGGGRGDERATAGGNGDMDGSSRSARSHKSSQKSHKKYLQVHFNVDCRALHGHTCLKFDEFLRSF